MAHSIFSLTPAPSNVAISVKSATAARTTERASAAPLPFAEPHVEIEQRLHAEMREQFPVCLLLRAVPEDAVVERGGRYARGKRRGNRHGEAVDDHEVPPLRRAEHCTHEHGDLAAAEFGEQLDGVLWRRAPLAGRAQNAVLALEAGIVEPGAAPDALAERHAREPVHQERRRRRVADAHLAENERIAVRRNDAFHDPATLIDRRATLELAQRGLDGEVARAAAHFRLDETRMCLAIGVYAGVHDPKIHALQSCEHVDGGAACKEVLDHLLGDGARIGAHTAVRDAVVGGEHHRDRSRYRRRQRPLRGTDLCREGSSRPSAPSGFVSVSRRRYAAASTAASAFGIATNMSTSCAPAVRDKGSRWNRGKHRLRRR
jgi:hypothetical protein